MSQFIKVKKGDREIRVTEKAFRVVYSAFGYHKIGESEAELTTSQSNQVDLFDLSREELEKVKKDEIKAFLDNEGIQYNDSALKPELINIVLGED
ncbi:hypothetical protein [Priestia flexa]|uniref:hypothetical protein n=1 Tax=Priestia flexa TaxID=86664 RepID=UPI001CFE0BAC|nr:hypothetical protein [Priestia flexa]